MVVSGTQKSIAHRNHNEGGEIDKGVKLQKTVKELLWTFLALNYALLVPFVK